MKKLIIFSILILLYTNIYSIDKNFTYHDLKWGMNEEQVKKIIGFNNLEMGERNKKITSLKQHDNICDNSVEIEYIFYKNKLTEISLIFIIIGNDRKFYDCMTSNLQKKYGAPFKIAKNANGVHFAITWKTKENSIILLLNQKSDIDGMGSLYTLSYSDLELYQKKQKETEIKKIDKF